METPFDKKVMSLDTLPLDLHFLIFSNFPTLPSLDIKDHPLLALACASRNLHAAVGAYASHSIRTYPTASRPKRLKNLALKAYLTYASKHCRFCGRNTVCVAKVFNNIVCCRPCDKLKWPDKITLSNATNMYGLKRDMLVRQCVSGTYIVMGIRARMFLLVDVKELARKVHGDLDEWLRIKEKKSMERARKRVLRDLGLGDLEGPLTVHVV